MVCRFHAFTIGNWSIQWYGIIMALALLAGIALTMAMFKRSGKGFKRPFCVNEACERFLPEDKRGYPKKKTEDSEEKEKKSSEKKTAKKTEEKKPAPKKGKEKASKEKTSAKKSDEKKSKKTAE